MKLTYEEYKKASDAGAIVGQPCACMGPQNGEEFCRCLMNFLNMVDDEGKIKLAEDFRKNQHR